MRALVLIGLVMLVGCAENVGGLQWASVNYVDDRGGWGCSTSVLTDQGMVLTSKGCTAALGTRLCVQPVRQLSGPEAPRYRWKPSPKCGVDEEAPDA